jgi:hypothetical protein
MWDRRGGINIPLSLPKAKALARGFRNSFGGPFNETRDDSGCADCHCYQRSAHGTSSFRGIFVAVGASNKKDFTASTRRIQYKTHANCGRQHCSGFYGSGPIINGPRGTKRRTKRMATEAAHGRSWKPNRVPVHCTSRRCIS